MCDVSRWSSSIIITYQLWMSRYLISWRWGRFVYHLLWVKSFMSGNRTSYINENCELEFGYYYDNACYAKLKSIISFHMVNPVHSVKSNKKKHYGKRLKKKPKKIIWYSIFWKLFKKWEGDDPLIENKWPNKRSSMYMCPYEDRTHLNTYWPPFIRTTHI